MSDINTTSKHEIEFKAEMKQLLHLIIHSLYTQPEIFLRELVSNSTDALNKLRVIKLTDDNILNPTEELKIKITINPEDKTFSIEDNGIGMDENDLVNQLGTIASSGTLKFLEELKKNNNNNSENLIGQFGVGFYSVFMVTDEVTVETRKYNIGSQAYKWTSKGESSYTVEQSDREDRGTKISFKFKEANEEFATEYRIKDVLNKYSNFIDFPIELNANAINKVQAIWFKKKEDISIEEASEFYKFISNDWNEPLDYFNLNVEGNINFKAMLFVPKDAPMNLFQDIMNSGVQLYSNKVMIQRNSIEFLPEYLRFLKGVIDTEDITLNVSREVAQNTPVISKIRNVLTSKVLSYLEDLRSNNQDMYNQFYKNFASLFKSGLNSDYTNKDRIVELLQFESTTTELDKYTTFNSYVSRMKAEQTEIYYVAGNNRKELERISNMEYFTKNGIEVLFFTDPVDLFILPYISEYDKKKLVSIEKADIKDTPNTEEENNKQSKEEMNSLISHFKEVLGNKVEDVRASKRLVNSAYTLVSGTNAMDIQMEKMMRMMDKDYALSQKILEINLEHPLVHNLNNMLKNGQNSKLDKFIEHIYETCLLNDGILTNIADYSDRMLNIMIEASN
ncbi:MAG TPA: molecular chaperone HtpG [Candidatus Kapabacteria bacterium]|nr:molecular chaperone HtpG [Candidatus Kapabacteria bacterium]